MAGRGKDTKAEHVMISYQWENQPTILKVKDKLESAGYKVWMDVENMSGSILDAVSKAVEDAAVVLICMSEKYKNSKNCRTEAEYTYKLEKPFIPLILQRKYIPDGWLGGMMGTRLYFDFSREERMDDVCAKLIKELGNRGKRAICERSTRQSISEAHCEQCDKEKKEVKATTLEQKLSSFNENELASDFLECLTLTEDTVLYHGAQIAPECTSATSKPEKRTTSKQAKIDCLEFTVKRPEDTKKVKVTGVLCVLECVIVVDTSNVVLKVFDQTGTFLSSTGLKHEYCTWGITYVRDATFATCGAGNTVYLWTVRGKSIVSKDVSYHVDHDAQGIHYNGAYYCVLHRKDDAITILDRKGRQVRMITTKEAFGKKFEFGMDIHMDSDTNNIYVPCENENGVLCMTIEGQALWFTPLSGLPCGIAEIQGTLCVAECFNGCLHAITKEGEFLRRLLDKDDMRGKPDYVCYGQYGKLYISYYSYDVKQGMFCVYTISGDISIN